jgi:hypothetical protein
MSRDEWLSRVVPEQLEDALGGVFSEPCIV